MSIDQLYIREISKIERTIKEYEQLSTKENRLKKNRKNAQLKRKLQFREYDQKVLDAPKRLITQKKKRN